MAEFVEECAANNLMKGHVEKRLAKCQHDAKVNKFVSALSWFFSGLIAGYAVGK